MARASVNLLVGAGSAATLAASLAGIAQADGYWDPGQTGTDNSAAAAASVAADPVTGIDAGGDSVSAIAAGATESRELVAPALPALGPLAISPARAVSIPPPPGFQIDDLAPRERPAGGRATVDVGAFVPAPVAAPAPRVVTVQAPAPAAPAPAPAMVPAPPPPPAPRPPTATTKAS